VARDPTWRVLREGVLQFRHSIPWGSFENGASAAVPVFPDCEQGTRGQTMNSTRVAIYARVSTSNGQQDPEMQLRELREYAKHRGLIVIGEYVDRMSGSKDSRPALNQLMTDASRRKFDAVLVWKLDRFGRSLRHLVNAIAELEALGVAFISFRDNLDLSTPSGRLMFQIIGAMAEFERALIQERVKAGLRNAKAKGKKLGRPRADVDQSQVEALRASGASWRDIAQKLGIGLGTVHRSLQPRSKNASPDFSNGQCEPLHV
jgi:DNA invertase Pin-like site-specific DNA recombinase